MEGDIGVRDGHTGRMALCSSRPLEAFGLSGRFFRRRFRATRGMYGEAGGGTGGHLLSTGSAPSHNPARSKRVPITLDCTRTSYSDSPGRGRLALKRRTETLRVCRTTLRTQEQPSLPLADADESSQSHHTCARVYAIRPTSSTSPVGFNHPTCCGLPPGGRPRACCLERGRTRGRRKRPRDSYP